MLIPSLTVSAMDQGRALVQAVRALGAVETSNTFEREIAKFLQAAFELRLQEIVDIVSAWDIGEILSVNVDASMY